MYIDEILRKLQFSEISNKKIFSDNFLDLANKLLGLIFFFSDNSNINYNATVLPSST